MKTTRRLRDYYNWYTTYLARTWRFKLPTDDGISPIFFDFIGRFLDRKYAGVDFSQCDQKELKELYIKVVSLNLSISQMKFL